MSKFIRNTNISEENYATPSVDVLNVAVDSGFEASMPNIVITPWESDNDSLIL